MGGRSSILGVSCDYRFTRQETGLSVFLEEIKYIQFNVMGLDIDMLHII